MNPTIKNKGIYLNYNLIAITLILIAEICFFTMDTITYYWILSAIGMGIIFVKNLNKFQFKVKKSNLVLWLLFLYGMYFVYGFCFLRKGDFPWDTLAYRLLENIALYIAIRQELNSEYLSIAKPFAVAGIFSLVYLLSAEKADFFAGGMRIGSALSGNVNTVGYNFGFISTMIMWWYCKDRKAWKLLLFTAFSIIMLLTGSKKVIIILVLDLIMMFMFEKGKASRWLKIGILFFAGVYIIFNVPYVYNIIGVRIESMFSTMFAKSSSISYSYSTDIRNEMITEGFMLFKSKPFFGGGWNYFYANTSSTFEYSHNNYVEMLCSFGVFGFILFYSRHVKHLIFTLKRVFKNNYVLFDYVIIAFICTILALTLDWAAVTFSAQSVWYLPVITSAAFVDKVTDSEREGIV